MSTAIFLCLTLVLAVAWKWKLGQCAEVSGNECESFQLCDCAFLEDSGGVFYLNCLGWNADDDVVRLHIPGDHRASSDEGVIANRHAREHRRVVRKTHAAADTRLRRLDVVDVVNIMVVGIDVGEV